MSNYYFSWDAGWGDTIWHLTNALIHCENSKQDMLIDLRDVENFLSTDRRVFGKKAYDKIPNYQEMFNKYGGEKVIL
jgi:hypothetical protein